MKRNNILQIFSSSSWGGGELYVLDLTKRLIEDNHNVLCITKRSNVIIDKLKTLYIPYFTLPINGFLDIKSALSLRKIIEENCIDIIHVHNFKTLFPIVYAKLLSKTKPKIILSRHLIKRAKKGILYNWLYSHIDRMIFVSNMALEEFFLSSPNMDRSKCTVIHNSIKSSSSGHSELNIKREYNIEKDTLLLTFTGRIVRDKGVDVLIKAFSKLRDYDINLIIAGEGDEVYMSELKELVERKNLSQRVYFLGFVKDINPIISQSDIGVFPSVWREPFGLSIIEFMQAGKPVITTNNGAQKEYITNKETGVLVDPNNIEELFEAIELFIKDKELRKDIGLKAKEYFENNLSYEQFYKKIISTYK